MTKNKILVMDDEEMIGEIACQIIKFLGLEAVWVSEGAEAIHEYKKQMQANAPFSAVIMDLTIPNGMGGKEAITEILSIDKDAKVFVSSGYSTDPMMLNFKDYGFTGVLNKPFDLNALQQTLAPFVS